MVTIYASRLQLLGWIFSSESVYFYCSSLQFRQCKAEITFPPPFRSFHSRPSLNRIVTACYTSSSGTLCHMHEEHNKLKQVLKYFIIVLIFIFGHRPSEAKRYVLADRLHSSVSFASIIQTNSFKPAFCCGIVTYTNTAGKLPSIKPALSHFTYF